MSAQRHAAWPAQGDYVARNPGQQWRTRFDGRGFVTTPDDGGWSWGLELSGYGRGRAQRGVSSPFCVDAHGGRVEYQWDEALTEWYINDTRGLEHGYTVKSPESNCSENGDAPLQFTLSVRGDLLPRISSDGRSVTFVNDSGAAVVNYSGLLVIDADGAQLPAWFEKCATPPSSSLQPASFSIVVDDRGARYPLTIDPLAQQAYIKASNTGIGDVFGNSVAISGNTLVVGAYQEASNATGVNGNQADNSASGAGAVYVFVRSGTTWSQQAYLKASNTELSDNFGWSVAVSGDTIVVGALREDSNATGVNGNQADNSFSSAGAAYVFVRDGGGNWSQQAYLKASNTGQNDGFGRSVAVSGDTIVVGASNEDSNATGINGNDADNSAQDAGAAYVFVRSGVTWSQQAYIKASNAESFDGFGFSLALSGETLLVGAPGEASISTGVNGDQVNNSLAQSGAAYVFVRSGTVWSQQAYIKASNTGFNDFFGTSVALSADTCVVGAYSEDSIATGVDGNQADNSGFNSGAAYVFFRSGVMWSQQAYLKASNTDFNDEFGGAVAVAGDTVIVGAYKEGSSATGINGNQADNSTFNAGAAYVFSRSGSTWTPQAYVKASNTGSSDAFGVSLAASGDTLVVGAQSESSDATGVNGDQNNNNASTSGAVYVFLNAPCPTLGDMNCDCMVDLLDVDPFVLALLDPVAYALAYPPPCSIFNGDMQPDGNVDGGDVQAFVDLVVP
ncbi:hypothetical protein B7486_17095 [cyanobacterium TDX16]|nr:hypothetical protein B7486_17095 [cyanobacterium TDX16]